MDGNRLSWLILLAVFVTAHSQNSTQVIFSDPLSNTECREIRSLNYPEPYPNNVDTVWIFEANSSDARITLRFFTFKLENGYDFVAIGSGSNYSDETTLLLTATGFSEPGDITSLNNSMWIRFRTDYSVGFEGFFAAVSVNIQNCPEYTGCSPGSQCYLNTSRIDNHLYCWVSTVGYSSYPCYGHGSSLFHCSCDPYYRISSTGGNYSCRYTDEWDTGVYALKCYAPCTTDAGVNVRSSNGNGEVTNVIMDGDYVQYSCPSGYAGSGTETVNCTDGVWDQHEQYTCSAIVVTCDSSECSSSYFDPDLHLDPDQDCYASGANVTVTCYGEYAGPPPNGYVCNNGVFNFPPASCDVAAQPCFDAPPSGVGVIEVEGAYANGTVITFECAEGYENVTGSQSVYCSDGNWYLEDPGAMPYCSPVTPCVGAPPSGVGIVKQEGTHLNGSVITFECAEGYENVTGSRFAYCAEETWYLEDPHAIPYCSPKPCVGAPPSGVGIVEHEGTYENGTVLTFECAEGYKNVTGSQSAYCVRGNWYLEDPDAIPYCSQINHCDEATCLNGGTCLNQINTYECRCSELYMGQNCEIEYGICTASGDPHYKTYDGLWHHYQGDCQYILTQDCDEGNFTIEVDNQKSSPTATVSYTAAVIIRTPTLVIDLMGGRAVRVNGIDTIPPYNHGGASISVASSYVMVHLDMGVWVMWDGSSRVEVKALSVFKSRLCGLCGDYDGNATKEDEFIMRDGQSVSNEALFGNSWNTEEDCTSQGSETEPCDSVSEEVALSARETCSLITDGEGVFATCHDAADPAPFYAACTFDYCAAPTDGNESLCTSLASYAQACKDANVDLQNWRQQTPCVLTCPVNSVYSPCTSACPPTCADPIGNDCYDTCDEGCACEDGYLLEDTQCIAESECGCYSGGIYYKQFEGQVLSEDCMAVCSCNSTGDLMCEEVSCHANADCTVQNGESECLCRFGYEGDGFTCENIDECQENECVNGTCVDGIGRYTCDCWEGSIGTYCDEVDDCFNRPCVNGTCTDLDGGGYQCECYPGFEGDNCSIALPYSCSSPPPAGEFVIRHPQGGPYYNGTVVEYSCPHGLTLVGSTTAMCLHGSWILDATPSCIAHSDVDPSDVILFCGSTYFQVDIPDSMIARTSHESDLYFAGDPYNGNCRGFRNGNYVTLNSSLTGCGTSYSENNNMSYYSNAVEGVNMDNSSHAVVEYMDLEIPVTCEFERSAKLQAHFSTVNEVLIKRERGNFEYEFAIYEDVEYDQRYIAYPVVVSLGSELYFRAELLRSPGNLQIHLRTCHATPSPNYDDPIVYPFISDGCGVGDAAVRVLIPEKPTQADFEVISFRFTHDLVGESAEVYIHCEIVLCDVDDDNSECSQGCEQPRHRRSVGNSYQRVQRMVQGPIVLGGSSDHQYGAASAGKGGNTDDTLNTFTVVFGTFSLTMFVCIVVMGVALVKVKHGVGHTVYQPLSNNADDLTA